MWMSGVALRMASNSLSIISSILLISFVKCPLWPLLDASFRCSSSILVPAPMSVRLAVEFVKEKLKQHNTTWANQKHVDLMKCGEFGTLTVTLDPKSRHDENNNDLVTIWNLNAQLKLYLMSNFEHKALNLIFDNFKPANLATGYVGDVGEIIR